MGIGLSLVLLTGLAGCSDPPPPVGPTPAPAATPVRLEPWPQAGPSARRLTTDHYVIYTTLGPSMLREGIGGFLEAARANYVYLTALEPAARAGGATPRRLVIYLFANRDEWANLTEQITGPASATYLKVQRGGYCFTGTCVFWDIGLIPTYSVASHEGMHQFLYHAVRDALPVWAEEGMAVLCEGYVLRDGLVHFDATQNLSRMTTLRQSILQDRWRPVDRLIAMSAADNVHENALFGADYYSQLWALMLLIRQDERYAAGLARLLGDAADGQLGAALGMNPQAWNQLQHNGQAYTGVIGPRAFTQYIEPDLPAFEARYRAFAEEMTHLK